MEKYKDKQWLQEHMKNNTVSEIAKEIGCGEITIQQFTAFKPLAHRPKPMLAKP